MSASNNTPVRHEEHDAIREVVRGWFTTSAPEIGYMVTARDFGILGSAFGRTPARLIVTTDDATAARAALHDAWEQSDHATVTVWIDDRARFALLDEVLKKSGCKPVRSTTHLALVGNIRAAPGPPSLCLESSDAERLALWATCKIKCFDDSEEEPNEEKVSREIAVRQSELALARLNFVTVDAEPVGVLGYYSGHDQLVFNLGTRVPFRHRAIAQSALALWVSRASRDGARSMMINATEGGRPEKLYQSLGFTDEIYWFAAYTFNGPDA
jgi:hypothetical protein